MNSTKALVLTIISASFPIGGAVGWAFHAEVERRLKCENALQTTKTNWPSAFTYVGNDTVGRPCQCRAPDGGWCTLQMLAGTTITCPTEPE